MKYLGVFILITLITACGIWAPGQDPRGKEMISNANQILQALNRYAAENSKYPSSLNELVPKYIEDLPREPSIFYKENDGSLHFKYSPSWPQYGNVRCGANIGQDSIGCIGYL